MEKSKELVRRIKSQTKNNSSVIIDLMDELSDELCRVADLAECVRQVHPVQEVSLAAQEVCLAVNSFVEELNTDVGLYEALRGLMDSEGFVTLDEVAKRTAQVFMHDFEISGIHLEESCRRRVVELNEHLLEVGYDFTLNASQPTLVCPTATAMATMATTTSDECLPATMLKQCYHTENGVVHVDYVPYDNPDAKIRKNGYKLFYALDRTKLQAFEDMVLSRRELARISGYPSFAHRQLKMSMAESPETVMDFLESLSEKVMPLAKEDVAIMGRIQREHFPSMDFSDAPLPRPWDVPLLVGKARELFLPAVLHSTTSGGAMTEPLKKWFPLSACLRGLDNLSRRLFGVELREMPIEKGEVWHHSVYKFGFFNTAEKGEGEEKGEGGNSLLLGYTYGDLFAREGKLASDCHFTIRGGRKLTGNRDGESGWNDNQSTTHTPSSSSSSSFSSSYQLPVITLCCNIEQPSSTSSVTPRPSCPADSARRGNPFPRDGPCPALDAGASRVPERDGHTLQH